MMMSMPLIILCGPTGVGKSELALLLAEELDAEIIVADAGQVYRGFDIGTAKPAPAERERVPHHGIDLCNPNEQCDAVIWSRAAEQAITETQSRGRRVLLVGGTGFYLRALLYGVFPGPDPDLSVRQRLRHEYECEGGEALHQRLQAVDPMAAAKIHPNDPVRLVRALEVYEQTGRPISHQQAAHGFKQARYPYQMIACTRERDDLYARIDQRVETMMQHGWLAEAKGLLQRWGPDVPAFNLIGYKMLGAHLQGGLAASALTPAIQQTTRHYAKRQLTWFRGEQKVRWLNLSVEQNPCQKILDALTGNRKHEA